MTRLPASREIMSEAMANAAQAVAAPVAPAVQQDELFAVPISPRLRKSADANALTPAAIEAEGERRRKAGRPPGAQNRSTVELRKFILAGGVLPQKWMMDWLLMEPEQLAARLGCTLVEAFDRLVALADKLAPYTMARMAPSDDKGNAVPFFEFHLGNSAGDQAKIAPWQLDERRRQIAAGLDRVIDGEVSEVAP